MKIRKGVLEQEVSETLAIKYLDRGWEKVEETKKPKPKTYNDYTKSQLTSMASNRSIYINSKMKKQEIIDRLLKQDEQEKKQPSNKGFTDNLIK